MLKKFFLIICFLQFSLMSFAMDVKHYTLSNGLQLFVKENHRAKTVVFQIWYKVGASDEEGATVGISHALEHMMFRGTANYPPESFSKIIAEHGGIQNAATSEDYTFYFQELPRENVELSFQLESDRMSNLLLNKELFEKELKVIKEERRLRTDNDPKALTFEKFLNKAHIEKSYQHPVIGLMSDIGNLNVLNLRAWYERWYAPNNAIVVVVGDVNPKEVYRLANQYFGKIKPKKILETKHVVEPLPNKPREIIVKARAKLPILMMGYNVPTLKTSDQQWKPFAIFMLAAILDGCDSSRFKIDIVRGKKIAVDTDVFYKIYGKLSNLMVIAGTPSPDHSVNELKQEFLRHINQMKTDLVTQEELEKIKTQIIAEKIYSKDSIMGQAEEIGSLESVGLSWKESEDFISNVEKITPKQIQMVAKEFFVPERLTVAVLEPR